jgi:hypothetical protein
MSVRMRERQQNVDPGSSPKGRDDIRSSDGCRPGSSLRAVESTGPSSRAPGLVRSGRSRTNPLVRREPALSQLHVRIELPRHALALEVHHEHPSLALVLARHGGAHPITTRRTPAHRSRWCGHPASGDPTRRDAGDAGDARRRLSVAPPRARTSRPMSCGTAPCAPTIQGRTLPSSC